jgi:hypothetical protein
MKTEAMKTEAMLEQLDPQLCSAATTGNLAEGQPICAPKQAV